MILDRSLTLDDFQRVVRGFEAVDLAPDARDRIRKARAVIERIVDSPAAVYGVNTGFGKFATIGIDRDQLGQLQRNLIVSHAIGVGAPLPGEVVRGMLLLRAQSLRPGSFWRARRSGGPAAVSAQRRRHTGDSGAGFGGRVGRPRAAGPPRPGADRAGRTGVPAVRCAPPPTCWPNSD